MITINFLGELVNLKLNEHAYTDNGRRAFQAVIAETGELFGTLTVNLDTPLADDEICVKVWSENASWVPQVLEQLKDKFIPTGREVPTGFVRAPIYKVAS